MNTIQQIFPASAQITISLAALANSATAVAGRESDAISNSANLYYDYVIGGTVRTGATLSGDGLIEIWAHAAVNDTPTYVDAVTGNDADITFTSRQMLTNCLRLLATLNTLASAVSRFYWMDPVSLREVFGFCPRNFGIVVINRSTGALNTTGSDHAFYASGRYFNQES